MRSLIKRLQKPNILMFGAPGAGKGTYGNMLSTDLRHKFLSTGDAIRSALKSDSANPAMKRIQEISQSGGLIDDSMILEIVLSNIQEESGDYNGFIFDGFPRTVPQAEMFFEHVDTSYSYVINLIQNEQVIIDKLSGRRVCQDCGTGYNFCNIDYDGYKMEPLLPDNPHGDCDNCGGKLIRREDDDPEVIKNRLEIYRNETEPILESFEKEGIPVFTFEAKKGKKDYPKLLDHLEKNFVTKMGLGTRKYHAAQ